MHEYSYHERHMGTDVSLSFVCPSRAIASAIATDTFATIHTYELRFSRFLPDSELSQLNQQKSLLVSHDFMRVLTKSLELQQRTGGAFNPLVQIQQLGYTKTFTALSNTTSDVPTKTYDTDPVKIKICNTTNRVTLTQNQQLDFGGLLKGYLADQLANTVMTSYQACSGCIINIGGDLSTRGYDEIHKPFIFQLYNPVTGEETAVPLTDTALATSGTYARTWHTNSGYKHHIVNADTHDNSTSTLVAVSIIEPDGALAEALTKLFLVRGLNAALALVPPENYYQYFAVSRTGDTYSNLDIS